MKFTEQVRKVSARPVGWIANHKKLSIALGVILAIIILIIATSGKKQNAEHIVVERQNIVEQVQVAGTVEADVSADMGFENGGVVRSVSVAVNDVVKKGQQLVSLDLGTLPAELASAQANVAIKRAQIGNTAVTIESVKEKQNALVETAYQNLLSQGLTVVPESSTYVQKPPVITGRYSGNEGTYKLVIARGVQDRQELRTFDLERTSGVVIEKTGPTRLGTHGLFVSFPDPIDTYVGTVWYLDIPNEKSAQYLANYNAYQEALRERDRAIADAEATLREQNVGVSIAQAELLQANAEVARIRALISQRILTAPFDGTITAVNVDPGESVTAGTAAIAINSKGMLGVSVNLPEIDSIKVMPNDPVSITLDAFDANEIFTGVVASVNRAETIVDGVSVYEARIIFDTADERIASGMTADVIIETNRKDDVIAIPARAITYRPDGTPTVLVQVDDNKTEEREIAVGIRGSNSMVEVRAGIAVGDTIVVPSAK